MTKEELDRFTNEEVRAAYLDMDRQLTELMQRSQTTFDDAAAEVTKLTAERDRWKADYEAKAVAYATVYEELQTMKASLPPATSPEPVAG